MYPVCAAVCPKGIGRCPSPGRCFLFTDADGNAFCDYTSKSGAIPTRTTSAVRTRPTAEPTNPVLQTFSPEGFFKTILTSAFVTGTLLFLIFTGILFALIMTGKAGTGIRTRETLPVFALSSLFGLGLSLITNFLLAGDAGAGTAYALTYLGIGSLLSAYLWYKGVMTRKIVLLAAALGSLAGFVFLAPIMPLELGGIINVITGVSAMTYGVIIICAVIILALVAGRTFCGTICPAGLLQELGYAVPGKKIVPWSTPILEGIRFAVFAVTIIAEFYLIDLMSFTGLYDLFSLTVSAGLAVASGILLVSVFLYSPICRIICPFGVLFSLFAEFSWFRLRRTESCINCRKCEKACPTRTAGQNDSKRECYLCGHCTGVCPVGTALRYRR